MGLFDDMLLGGGALAFAEHEHTKHQRQRLEAQYAMQQQQLAYRPSGPPPQGDARGTAVGGYGQTMIAGSAGPSYGFCPNCGFNLHAQPQQQYQPPPAPFQEPQQQKN
jgi:hypothetical protein